MNNTHKIAIIIFLQQSYENVYDQFNEAFALYRKSPNKNISVEAQFNRAGYSESGLKNLLYDLQKINQITDLELTEKVENNIDVIGADVIQLIPIDAVPPVDEIAEAEKPIREEFPFLNEKDCPTEMYVVVGKRIAAFKQYQKLHAELQNAITENTENLDQTAIDNLTCEVEAAFSDNQALWKELNYFKENKKILGDHPILFEAKAKAEVDKMTSEELVKYRGASMTYFSKKKTELEKLKDEEKIAKIRKGIAQRNYKMELVLAKLNMGAK